MARAVAIRSGIWDSAAQARHQSRMSLSLGAWTPCSILLTRVKCWPVAAASALADRPASWRSSRSRAPSASRACLAELEGVILTVWYGELPHGVERRSAELDVCRVGGCELARVQAVPGIGEEDHEEIVYQVEVISGDRDGGHEPAGHPPDVLPGIDHGLSNAVGPALVVAEGFGDDPGPANWLTSARRLA